MISTPSLLHTLKKGILYALFSLPIIFSAHSQTYKWSNVAIGGGGFVDGIITSKSEANVMFARTDVGGAYRWDATNSKWIPLLDWTSENETGYQGVESIAIDPQAAKNVYMLVGTSYFNSGKTAILRSTDYGNTFAITDVSSQFKAHGNGMGRQNGEKLVVDPNKGNILFCGTRYNGVFRSTDSGASWSNLTTTGNATANANGISFVLVDGSSATTGNASQTVFFGVSQTGTNFYKSTNGGTSFTAVAGAPTSLMPQRAVLASDKNMYITYADKEGPWNPASGQIWKYNVTTGAWTNVTPSGTTFPYSGISVDPNNPQRLIASTINVYWTQYAGAYGDRFFLSTDGGQNWRDLVGNSGITLDPNGCTWMTNNGQTIHWAGCIEFNPFNTAQAHVISGNGLFTCDNVNATNTTWKFNAIGIEETVALDIVSITGGPMFSVIGDYDGFRHSDVTQFAPIHTPRMGTTTGIAFAALSSSKLVRVGGDNTGGKMYYTTNQGTNWTQTSSINGYKGKLAMTADGGAILHCPEGSSTMYRSTNSGTSWATCGNISIADAVPVADMVNANKVYAYNSSSGIMMVSTDGGANFANGGSPGSGGSKIIRTVPGIEGDIWVPLYTGGLTHSTNSGASFTKLTSVTRCDAVGLGKAAPSATYHTLYIWGTVGGVTGVFRSIDKGVSWTRINDDNHEYGGTGNGQFVTGDMNVYGRVYMSTVGRGIPYGELQTASCTATATAGGATTFCTGGSVTLTASAGSSWKWFNGTTQVGTNQTLSATTSGSYTVEVTDAASCKATSSPIVVTVNALPTATITAGGATTFCSGGSVTLTASAGSSYKWLNGTTQVGTASTYAATTSGSYTVEVTNANTCKATSAATTVTVNALPTASITAGGATTFCSGGSVTLTASAGSSYKWLNGTTQVGTASTYSATTSGSYTVEVTNANTCKATSAATTVTVNALPTAAITAGGATTFCSGGSVTLTASAGSSYKWLNGTTQVGTTSTYAATTSGSYTVEVTNANTCKATSAATTVTVNALPTATITAGGATTFCTGGSVTLTASAGSSYKWLNGTTQVGTASTYAATTSGSYTVEVTNANTCKATSAATTVTVNALPTASITAGGATTFCTGGSVTLTASAGSSYKWLNGTTQVGTASTYAATTSGSYTVEVTNANTCKATSAATTVTVNALPTASITAGGATTFCSGGSVTLTASAGSSYKWLNGTTQVGTASTYSATTSGSYTVEVTNANTCKATSAATTVTVNALPTATITAGGATTFCSGGSVTLTASAGSSYKWLNGTTQVGTASTYSATTSGSYTVEVTNANTCKATSAATTVTVNALPTATITAGGPTTVCTGGVVALSSSAGSSYVWKNGSTTVGTNPTYNAFAAGSYTVEVTNANTCKATSAPVTVAFTAATTWYADTDGDGKGDPAVTQSSCSQPAGYVATAGDGCPADANKTAPGNCGCGNTESSCLDCAGVPNGTAAPDACSICSGGTTGRTPVTNVNNCTTTATQDAANTDVVNVIPNPSNDRFTLTMSQPSDVQIVTAEGKLVDVFNGVNNLSFGADYAKGVYFVQVSNGSKTQVLRVIKQ